VHGGHNDGLFWHPPVRLRVFIWAAIFEQGADVDFYGLERAPLYSQTSEFT
jgi:hypothetical protein